MRYRVKFSTSATGHKTECPALRLRNPKRVATFPGEKRRIVGEAQTRVAMNVNLKPELETLIASEVKAGRAADPGEFLSRAVYHYVVARDLGQEYTPEEIDRMICEGLDDINRGDTIDGEEAFRQLRALSAERRRHRT